MNTATNNSASDVKAFHAALALIDVGSIRRNATIERSAPRKELAAAARALFKSLGLRGISVTAPNYSMAQSVDVTIPKREDYVFDELGMVSDEDEARVANNEAQAKLAEILYVAFPSHRDRSDSQSDHFDYKWSVH